jgi:rhodanese-related sulfurtransferase
MGFGFIVGGFCPGTSLVAAATAKMDGVLFVLGVFFGIFVFGETVENFETFFYSSYMGRFTLMDWLNVDTGWVVLGVVLMALFMFWGAEKLEGIFGGVDQTKAPKMRIAGAGLLVALAVGAVLIGQPTTADKWAMLSSEKEPLLKERVYQIHPGELLDLMHNDQIILHMLDVRSESDYNLFHLKGAEHAPLDMLADMMPNFLLEPSNAVFVLMGNDETLATEAWKMLEAENVINVYILEGGINYWLDVFAEEGGQVELVLGGDDTLRHEFTTALGDRYPIASPEPHEFELEFVPKVKLELKQGPTGGGCG